MFSQAEEESLTTVEGLMSQSETAGGVRHASDGKSRIIHINTSQLEKFIGNEVMTAKYSAWSFIPSFLFEQFRRYSNIFFLVIALLQVREIILRSIVNLLMFL